ncbi:uncharacterized protein LOC131070152 [Cryptomeria japonica]|uniref:uncharacterized protein LOC131070152 n=1 Tax=Cryptomeria japonica TaxID=3369 RepID=UPI0027DA101B|nr:uncharacterized protein LOC131070152 [Cryptomeria japonica]
MTVRTEGPRGGVLAPARTGAAWSGAPAEDVVRQRRTGGGGGARNSAGGGEEPVGVVARSGDRGRSRSGAEPGAWCRRRRRGAGRIGRPEDEWQYKQVLTGRCGLCKQNNVFGVQNNISGVQSRVSGYRTDKLVRPVSPAPPAPAGSSSDPHRSPLAQPPAGSWPPLARPPVFPTALLRLAATDGCPSGPCSVPAAAPYEFCYLAQPPLRRLPPSPPPVAPARRLASSTAMRPLPWPPPLSRLALSLPDPPPTPDPFSLAGHRSTTGLPLRHWAATRAPLPSHRTTKATDLLQRMRRRISACTGILARPPVEQCLHCIP